MVRFFRLQLQLLFKFEFDLENESYEINKVSDIQVIY